MKHDFDMIAFVKESNKIEGINCYRQAELEAHRELLMRPVLYVTDVIALVKAVQPDAVIRDRQGLNVRVGNHFPPKGGVHIYADLERLLYEMDCGPHCDNPFQIHQRYETLHPFTDGNGRSGRAIWLWHMMRQGKTIYNSSFLHTWYYQSLSNWRE